MHDWISRRAVFGGALAFAGLNTFSGLVLAEGFALAADEDLLVGLINDRWPSKNPRTWHQMVRDDGSDQRSFYYPCDSDRERGSLAHGARVWAASRDNGKDGRRSGPLRILHLEPPESIVSTAARRDADMKAWQIGKWVNATVLLPHRHFRSMVLIRCHRLDIDDRRWLYRTAPIGALATAKAGDRVQVKFGKTWDGWRVFEARHDAEALKI